MENKGRGGGSQPRRGWGVHAGLGGLCGEGGGVKLCFFWCRNSNQA